LHANRRYGANLVQLDKANIDAFPLNPDVAGLDDRGTENVSRWRSSTLADQRYADQPWLCARQPIEQLHGKNERDSRIVFQFTFYDPKSQTKHFPEIAAGVSVGLFGRSGRLNPTRFLSAA